jgi:hypothetical protein
MRHLATATVLALAACGSDPTAVSLTDTWEGSYTHPTFPGTLELTLSSTVETITGTFTLRYGLSGGGIQNYGGTVTGTRPSATTVAFSIEAAPFTWNFTGSLQGDNRMTGTWESTTSSGIQGTFEVERQ